MIDPGKIEKLAELYRKQAGGELSDTERLQLNQMLDGMPGFREIFEEAADDEMFLRRVSFYYEGAQQVSNEEVRSQFRKSMAEQDVIEMRPTGRTWPKYIAAAAVVLFVALGVYFWQSNKQPATAKTEKEQPPTQQEIMPANGFAILVLEDGRKVVLDSLGNGVIGTNGGKDIVKQEGQLSYLGQSKEVVYNSLVTSKGKIMTLKLADGTQVWLNAESSIRFPTEFPGKERIVEITGEAFFSVAKNSNKPFKVHIKKGEEKMCEVMVTGTQFNINAYSDESSVEATLLEGSIIVVKDDSKRSLRPGQQAKVTSPVGGGLEGAINVLTANTDAVIAWKERNFFHFKNNDIKTIMRQLARWYDISVNYEGNLSDRTFSGQVSREMSLSAVLKMLVQANIHFSMKGREVTVKE